MTAGELASATILGGGGADSVSLDVDAASTAVKISTDAAGVVGQDTITIYNTAFTLDEANFQAAGGADVISINGAGDLAGTAKILGNAGGDAITLSATTFSAAAGLTIGGGAGNDTISLDEFGSAGSGAFVIGGGGADSIILDANDGGSAGAVSAGGGYGSLIAVQVLTASCSPVILQLLLVQVACSSSPAFQIPLNPRWTSSASPLVLAKVHSC